MIPRRQMVATATIISIATPAAANDFMFSAAAVPVVGLSFLLWLLIGAILLALHRRVMLLGVGGIVACFLILFFSGGHFELGIMIWMIYLALLVVYFLFPRRNLLEQDRRRNLLFHGTFLAIVIVGGVVSKILYYSHQGSYARWTESMRDILPGFACFFAVVAALVALWFRRVVRLRGSINANREEKAESLGGEDKSPGPLRAKTRKLRGSR